MLKSVFISEDVPLLGVKVCLLSVKTSRGVPSRADGSVRLPVTELAVVGDIWKRKVYLGK